MTWRAARNQPPPGAAADEACGILATWHRFPAVTARIFVPGSNADDIRDVTMSSNCVDPDGNPTTDCVTTAFSALA